MRLEISLKRSFDYFFVIYFLFYHFFIFFITNFVLLFKPITIKYTSFNNTMQDIFSIIGKPSELALDNFLLQVGWGKIMCFWDHIFVIRQIILFLFGTQMEA